ncbi:MAG: DUF1622 domain-containing protein [SAR202 cluster bacterium]|nr:hypothetical protein [Acidobacteriota bacterium]MBU81864.1 hypothetical protein [Chloroflexota bacterium]MDP6372538.1 DUF1622 domain-containing protein [Vicinamibacterales bacterium]MDP6800053.1 DUF1622 domain-containing protein [SAR202 cluster bacterium]MQG58445.1 DUF1622 domain-containing protein [SAR202 cluster bacterium]
METFEAILTSTVLGLKLVAEALSALCVAAGMIVALYRIARFRQAPSRRTGYIRIRLTMVHFFVLALEFQLAAYISVRSMRCWCA